MTGAPPTVRLAGRQYVTRVLYMVDPPARDAAVQQAVPSAIGRMVQAAADRRATVDWSTLQVRVLVPHDQAPYDTSPYVAVVAEADAWLPTPLVPS